MAVPLASLSGEKRGARRGCASAVERQAFFWAVGGPRTSGRQVGAGSVDVPPLCTGLVGRAVHAVAEARPDHATG